MATASPNQAVCNIVQYRTLELETKDKNPLYSAVTIMKEKLLVIGARNLQIFNLQDGKLICTSDGLESEPMDVCILSDTECAVCLREGKIEIMTSSDGVERVKTLDIRTGFDSCYSVTKWTSDKLLVSGKKGRMLRWCVVSLEDGSLDLTHDICEVKVPGGHTHVAVKDNKLNVSCPTFDSINNNGVHAFDVLNPRHKTMFLYQHPELRIPWSIMADRDYVFVCDWDTNTIHQVTDNGQLVTMHRMSSRIYGMFYDDQHGVLYTTSFYSNVIISYKME